MWDSLLCVTRIPPINRDRYIATILFRLNSMCRTIYHSFGIITRTQHISKQSMMFEFFMECVYTFMFTYNVYIYQVKGWILYFWNVKTCVEIKNRCLHHNNPFSCIYFLSGTDAGSCKLRRKFLFLSCGHIPCTVKFAVK